jgi:hypothetical protein
VAITNDLRPRRAMEEARMFLLYVFNSFADVSLVEMQWLVAGRGEPEEFGAFNANRRQIARLEEPNLDLKRLSDKSVDAPPPEPEAAPAQ